MLIILPNAALTALEFALSKMYTYPSSSPCAQGEGDTVVARVLRDKPGQVIIEAVEGDGGKLSLDAAKNCSGIAAIEVLKMIGETSVGVALTVKKGLPLGSGMGSSAASAAAGAAAVNALFGNPLTPNQLVLAGLVSEGTVAGYHADNIAPAVLGGFVLIRSADPLEVYSLPFKGELYFVLVNPKFECPTGDMRKVLPQEVPRSSWIANASAGGMLVAGILSGDVETLGKALDSDCIVEPVRGPLIPGFLAVKAAAKAAGAFGCTISGSGPTAVAIVGSMEQGERVKKAMMEAFMKEGKLEINSAVVTKLGQGARQVPV